MCNVALKFPSRDCKPLTDLAGVLRSAVPAGRHGNEGVLPSAETFSPPPIWRLLLFLSQENETFGRKTHDVDCINTHILGRPPCVRLAA
jgi:hypothetical protein